jgi:hypothetical protein
MSGGGDVWHTHGTSCHGQRASVDLMVRVIACLAAGLGMRAPARVFEVDPKTVRPWWVEAAEQLQACSAFLLCDVHVTPRQLDEL